MIFFIADNLKMRSTKTIANKSVPPSICLMIHKIMSRVAVTWECIILDEKVTSWHEAMTTDKAQEPGSASFLEWEK